MTMSAVKRTISHCLSFLFFPLLFLHTGRSWTVFLLLSFLVYRFEYGLMAEFGDKPSNAFCKKAVRLLFNLLWPLPDYCLTGCVSPVSISFAFLPFFFFYLLFTLHPSWYFMFFTFSGSRRLDQWQLWWLAVDGSNDLFRVHLSRTDDEGLVIFLFLLPGHGEHKSFPM